MKPTPCRSVSAGAHRDRDPGLVRGAAERQRHVLLGQDRGHGRNGTTRRDRA